MLRPGADPRGALAEIVRRVGEAEPGDDNALGMIGAGPLEFLLIRHEDELWEEIERVAPARTRACLRALRSVVAHESPRYEQRLLLLTELKEERPVTLSLVAYDESFARNGLDISSTQPRDLAHCPRTRHCPARGRR